MTAFSFFAQLVFVEQGFEVPRFVERSDTGGQILDIALSLFFVGLLFGAVLIGVALIKRLLR